MGEYLFHLSCRQRPEQHERTTPLMIARYILLDEVSFLLIEQKPLPQQKIEGCNRRTESIPCT